MLDLSKLESDGFILKKRLFEREFYRLKRPLEILVQNSAIEQLKNIYTPNGENGGLLVLIPSIDENGRKLFLCKQFINIPNESLNATNYQPNNFRFEAAARAIFAAGNIAVPIHTHPTNIGLESYDTKRANFYLKSSKADRSISFAGQLDIIETPEAIFVSDPRFDKGYKLAFYSGNVFPDSYRGLSIEQIGLLIFAAWGISAAKPNLVFILIIAGLILEFRKPKYIYFENGVSVNLSF
jgi:hypothetical protein